MNSYITGAMIKALREKRKMTQQELAEKLNVSDKAVSKWETGKGYPDIALLTPLAQALGVSVIELLSGENVVNTNRTSNMRKIRFYVCPVCGNVVIGTGESVVSCCGLCLPALEAEPADEKHRPVIEKAEDEYYICLNHEMSKEHYISFLAAVKDDGYELQKLYPEGGAEARFKIRRTQEIYFYCNQHGLFRMNPRKA